MGLFSSLFSKQDLYSGGDGTSEEEAVVINTTDHFRGVKAEYEWLEKELGPRGSGWKVKSQMQLKKDGRSFDSLRVVLPSGEERLYYFDTSNFYG